VTAAVRRAGFLSVGAALAAGVVAIVGLWLWGGTQTSPDSFSTHSPALTRHGITVAGNRLVDAGRTVRLRGVNVSGTEFACIQGGTPSARGWSIDGGQPLGAESIYAAMRSWGVQAVRVPLNEDCWLQINGVEPAFAGARYVDAVRTQVRLIEAAHMYAILDLHWSAPGRYAAYGQQSLPDADHSPAFWRSVARTFRDDGDVLFDLFNEPFVYTSYLADTSQPVWDCWLHGCLMSQVVTAGQKGPDGEATGYATRSAWRSAGMQELVDAVRGEGATQVIIVNGLDWANDDSGWLTHAVVDPVEQLAVGAHVYPAEQCAVRECWDSVLAPLSAVYPVVIGETGEHSQAPVDGFLDRFLAYADDHGWSYLAWTWNPWQDRDNVLITGWDGTPTSGEGAVYRAHLSAGRWAASP
jgi:endoglucanase